MSKPLDYRDLTVWQRSMDLVTDIYALTRALPKAELYGLTSQIRRAALSVPSNIAEGNGRLYRREYAHHISIACGSVAQLVTCLEIAQRLAYLSPEQVMPRLKQADEISRMLLMLMRALQKPAPSPR